MEAPAPVGDVASLPARLLARAAGAPAVLGLDLPIGLPRDYAARHAAAWVDFPAFLRGLAHRPAFFAVCAELAQVSPARPFWPLRGRRGMRQAELAAALGLDGTDALRRLCDRATPERPPAAPLFWTLGANQVGKAALHGWRHLLLSALDGPTPARLWPFEGELAALLAPGGLVLAETYPAEALRQLGLTLSGKRRQAARRGLGEAIPAVMERLDARPSPALRAALADGFGAGEDGEDRLDSLLGLLGVVNVLAGHRPGGAPDDPAIRRWEGWLLGQAYPVVSRNKVVCSRSAPNQAEMAASRAPR